MYIQLLYILYYLWFFGLWSVAVLNVLLGAAVCCMAVGYHGRSL
jgi:hypothetical protein